MLRLVVLYIFHCNTRNTIDTKGIAREKSVQEFEGLNILNGNKMLNLINH